HLSALERKGKLALRRDGRSRGIRLSDVAPAVPVPVIGAVAAGTEMLAAANLERTMMLDAEFVGSEGAWLLRVQDDAMNGAGIVECAGRRDERGRNRRGGSGDGQADRVGSQRRDRRRAVSRR